MSGETDYWPFVPARWFTKVGPSKPRPVRLIVIHDMEYFERGDTAEVIAHDFNTRPETSKASAHICVDNNSIAQCVYDSDVAYAAPNANHDGIQIELAGFARQSRAEWLDFYGIALLALASDAVAQYCIKFNIPIRRLTDAQVKDGKSKGICGHDNVTRAFKNPTNHLDPGPNFPWDYFLESVKLFYEERTRKIA